MRIAIRGSTLNEVPSASILRSRILRIPGKSCVMIMRAGKAYDNYLLG